MTRIAAFLQDRGALGGADALKLLVDLSCAECGSNRIDIPAGGGDDSPVVCEDCGHVLATFGELKERVEEAVVRGGRKE